MVAPALKILGSALQFSQILELLLSLEKILSHFLNIWFEKSTWHVVSSTQGFCLILSVSFVGPHNSLWHNRPALVSHLVDDICTFQWLRSWLPSRTFLFYPSPPKAPFTCGVQQGSILRPVLFSLYWHPPGSISTTHKPSSHPLAASHNSCAWQSHTAFCQVSTHMLSSSSPMEIRRTVHAFISLVTSPIALLLINNGTIYSLWWLPVINLRVF